MYAPAAFRTLLTRERALRLNSTLALPPTSDALHPAEPSSGSQRATSALLTVRVAPYHAKADVPRGPFALITCMLAALFAAAAAAPALSDSSSAGAVADAFRPREDQLALLVDRARTSAGVLPLARAAELDQAAIAHANEMVTDGYMDHDAPDGSTPASRAADAGYQTPPGSAWLVVEVISARGDQPEDALGWWLGDALHRRVLLRSTWREMGIGFAPGGPYGRFWVMEFGCRPNVLPPVLVDGTLTIPDETCATSASAFGPTQSVRVGESSDSLQHADWEPYDAQRAWAAGKPALVEARDAQGRDVTTAATDPRGDPREAQ